MPQRILASVLVVLLLSAPAVHATPANLWAHTYTGLDDKGFNEVTVDPFGNIVGVGYFYNTITINTLFTTLGFDDVFVAKFDPNGNPLWSKHLGGARGDGGLDIATDIVGNVIAVGDMGASPTDDNAYIVKYAPDGTQRFLKQFGVGDDSTQTLQYVTTDLSKNIIVAGEFMGSINLGGATLHDQGGPTIFLAKFDQNGNHIWSKRFVGTTEFIFSVGGLENTVDGQTTMFGILDGTLDFGNGPLTTAGGADIFLARFDASGNVVWAHKYGDLGNQYPGNIAVNESGQIALTGFADTPFNVGGGVLAATAGYDPFLAVFTPAGTHVWSKIFTGAGTQFGQDVTWSANEDVLLEVRGNGSLDFGGGVLTIAGPSFDAWIARFFGANGNHRWSTSLISTSGLSAQVEDDHGKLILAGTVAGNVNFGSGLITGTSDGDAFVAKFTDNLTGVSTPLANARLEQNVPNPFNPSTTIRYTLDAPGRAVIDIFDASGAVVTRLDEGVQPAGAHAATWNGRDAGGRSVASGVYFYRLDGMPGNDARKMVLLK
jgi:hypothetical protein